MENSCDLCELQRTMVQIMLVVELLPETGIEDVDKAITEVYNTAEDAAFTAMRHPHNEWEIDNHGNQ